MSETLAPPVETPAVQATPSAAVPAGAAHETAVGNLPPGAPSVSPAAPSLPTETAAPETPVAPQPAPSLLSTAKPAEADQPTGQPPEAEAAQPPGEAPPAEPLPLPTYEAFALPEGVQLDQERQSAFTAILGETEQKIVTSPAEAHALVQEMGQKLVNLYLDEAKANSERLAQQQQQVWSQTREQWVSEFKDDPEIGGNRRDTTLARCGAMVELYGRTVGPAQEQALRDAMTLTGAGDHPELLRFINWAAGYAVENSRMVAAPAMPQPIPMSRAQRMYRNSIPMNGAA
jgi:hypothetical protein